MKNRNARTNTAALAAAVTVMLLSGCHDGNEPEQQTEISYTVISDGEVISQTAASAESEDEYADVSETELYVPEHMATIYASAEYDTRSKAVYNDIISTMASFSPSMLMPLTVSVEDYVKILETVRCEQLSLFYIGERSVGDFNADAHTFEMDFSYRYSIKDTNIMLIETEKAARDIISEYTYSGMSDYEKLKAFHDYLVMNCETSTDDRYADSVYGALVNGKALCEGYAKAFSYLCNLSGIENIIVTGRTDVDHMWNMVKLDGNWYHVDVGWDKPDEALAEYYPDMVLYRYFLTDDKFIEGSRTVSNILYTPPEADSTEMSYYVHEDRYAESYDEALRVIEAAARKCMDTGEKYFTVKLSDDNLFSNTADWLITQGDDSISDIDRMMRDMNYQGKISYVDYYRNDRILIFVMEN